MSNPLPQPTFLKQFRVHIAFAIFVVLAFIVVAVLSVAVIGEKDDAEPPLATPVAQGTPSPSPLAGSPDRLR